MQYIFGDNRSSYAMIYTDGNASEAQKLHGLLRFPITPNEKFNTFGFITYGTNSNCPFLFSIKKDKSIPRSCYYVHGFNRDANPEYFSGGFFEDLCTDFISQETFDLLRDGGDAQPVLATNAVVAQTAKQSNLINKNVLCETIAQLYQKNKVMLAVDDSIYNDDVARSIVYQVFTYLSPSLRKATSFLTSVVEIGNAEVMLRVVPLSMLENSRESYMNIDGSNLTFDANSEFHNLAQKLMGEDAHFRTVFFENFEYLYSGYDSSYKKQNAEELFGAITRGDYERLEKIIDSHLTKTIVHQKEEMSSFCKSLCKFYNDVSQLESRLVFKETDVIKPAELFSTNNLFIYKLMLFSDIGADFLKNRLANACASVVISESNAVAMSEALKVAETNASNENLKPHEKYFYAGILNPVYKQCLVGRLVNYAGIRKNITEAIKKDLSPREPIEPSEFNEIKEILIGKAKVEAEKSADKNINPTAFIEKVVLQEMNLHNESYMTGQKDGTPRYPNEVVLSKLTALETAIQSGESNASIENMFADVFKVQSNYNFMIDNLIALYTIRSYNNGSFKPAFYRAIGQNFRSDSVTKRIEAYDPILAIAFVFEVCANLDKAFELAFACLEKNKQTINKNYASYAETSAKRICRALKHNQNFASADKKRLASEVDRAMRKHDANSNVCAILDVLKSFCKSGTVKTASAKKAATTRMLLAVVSTVAIIAIALAVIFAFDIISFNSDETASDGDVETSEVVETSDVSEDGAVSAGEEVSDAEDVTDDESSAESEVSNATPSEDDTDEGNADESNTDESNADESNADESNTDESNTDEGNIDDPENQNPNPDDNGGDA